MQRRRRRRCRRNTSPRPTRPSPTRPSHMPRPFLGLSRPPPTLSTHLPPTSTPIPLNTPLPPNLLITTPPPPRPPPSHRPLLRQAAFPRTHMHGAPSLLVRRLLKGSRVRRLRTRSAAGRSILHTPSHTHSKASHTLNTVSAIRISKVFPARRQQRRRHRKRVVRHGARRHHRPTRSRAPPRGLQPWAPMRTG